MGSEVKLSYSWVLEVLYAFWIKSFIRWVLCKYFLPASIFSFNSFKNVFQRTDIFICIMWNLSVCCLSMSKVLILISKTYLTQGRRVSPMFYSMSLIVLTVFMIPFDDFCIQWEVYVKVHFLYIVKSNCSGIIYWKAILSSLYCLWTLSKMSWWYRYESIIRLSILFH